jgi:hypothetical protein
MSGRQAILKILLLSLVLVGGSSIKGGATTLAGSFRNADGTPVANGRLLLRLRLPAVTKTSPQQVVNNTVICSLDATGAIGGACSVQDNANLIPTEYYVATLYDASTNRLWSQNWYITGASVDVGTLQQTTVGISFPNPIVQNTASAQSVQSAMTFSGTVTFSSPVSARNLNSIRFADQFAAGSSTGGIKEAMDNLPSTGGTIFLPAGTYDWNIPGYAINKPVTVRGAGRGISIIRVPDGANLNGAAFLLGTSASGPIVFEDFTFDGNRANQTSGAYSFVDFGAPSGGLTGVYLHRLEIKNVNSAGGRIGYGANTIQEVWVEDNTFNNNADRHLIIGNVDGAHIERNTFIIPSGNPTLEISTANVIVGTGTTALNNVWVRGNRFYGSGPLQNIVKTYGDVGDVLSNIHILDNYFGTAGSGDVVALEPSGATLKRVSVKGNHIMSSADGGIVVSSGSDIDISGNVVYDCDASAIAVSGATRFVVNGNVILNDQASTQAGISVNNVAAVNDFGVVEGNMIRAGASTGAVLVSSPTTPGSIQVSNNVISQGSFSVNAGVRVFGNIGPTVGIPASTGYIALASGDAINFRNNANSADINGLSKDSSDIVQVGGSAGARTAGPLIVNAGQQVTRILQSQAALTFGAIGAQNCGNQTITVSGAATSNAAFASPNYAVEAGLVWSAFVSATNTVTVRLCNVSTGSVTPAGGSNWRVWVIQE